MCRMSEISDNPSLPATGRKPFVPAEHTLDRVASERIYGWTEDSRLPAPFDYGLISEPHHIHHRDLSQLITDVRSSPHFSHWLTPVGRVSEVDIADVRVMRPRNEPLVVIQPDLSEQTGLIPMASYWQSGWESAQPHVCVRQEVYDRLIGVAARIRTFTSRAGLVIMDGWRSVDQQRELYDAFYPDGHVPGEPLYVSPPEMDDAMASPHPAGGAVDTFLAFDSKAIDLGSVYDYMHDEANTLHFEGNGQDEVIRDTRRILGNAMADFGFVPLDSEWWHFEFGTRRWAAKTGNEPIYGNAHEPDLRGSVGVEAVPFSRRQMMLRDVGIDSSPIQPITRAPIAKD